MVKELRWEELKQREENSIDDLDWSRIGLTDVEIDDRAHLKAEDERKKEKQAQKAREEEKKNEAIAHAVAEATVSALAPKPPKVVSKKRRIIWGVLAGLKWLVIALLSALLCMAISIWLQHPTYGLYQLVDATKQTLEHIYETVISLVGTRK